MMKRVILCAVVAVGVVVAGGDSRGVSAANRVMVTVAGTGQEADNGAAGEAREINIGMPFGVEIGPDGALYITEVANHRVRRLDLQTNTLSTVAGCGKQGYSGDGGSATEAELNEPYEVRFDRDGHMFFVEMQNHLVRRVDARTGRISTVAGCGKEGFGGDGGPATQALMKRPHSIVLDGQGNLYIADIGNHRVRRVDPATGLIDTIAGNGEAEFPSPGARADESPLPGPRALALEDRTLWIVLREGNALGKLELDTRQFTRVAGTGRAGYSGDGGPAMSATFSGPKGLAIGPDGRIFIVDSENDAVRVFDRTTGVVETVAGSGRARSYGGDGGPATRARMNQPHGICVAADGSIYLGDTLNHRVRKVEP